jgi:hypothetical protein
MANKYLWGGHAAQLAAAEGLKTQVRPSVRAGARSAVAIAFIFAPQQFYVDPPSWVRAPLVSGKTPQKYTFVSGAPQLADLTQQAVFQQSLRAGAKPQSATTFAAAPQTDPTQLAAQVWPSVASTVIPKVATQFFAIPPQSDPTQIAPSVWASQPAPILVGGVPLFISTQPYDTSQLAANVWAAQLAPPPAPPVITPPPPDITTIGGITQWTLQIPRIPEKKRITFVRNTENMDRADIADIVSFLRRL